MWAKCLKSVAPKAIFFKVHLESEDVFKNHLSPSFWLTEKIDYSSAGNSCSHRDPRGTVFFFAVLKKTAAAAASAAASHVAVCSGGYSSTSLVQRYTDEDWSRVFSLVLYTRGYIGFHAGCPFTRLCIAFLTEGPEAIRLLYLFIMFRLHANGLRCSPDNCA